MLSVINQRLLRFAFPCVSRMMACLAIAMALFANANVTHAARQDEDDHAQHEDTDSAQDNEAAEESKEAEAMVQDEPAVPAKSEYAPQFARLHMWDGSIVGGELETASITVTTEFGILEIPITKIREFRPGLLSFPEKVNEIETLVANLGSDDFDTREQAQRKLLSMGNEIRAVIGDFTDGGSAERKKRLGEIKKQIAETLGDEAEAASKSLGQGDTVVTPGFTIVGKIEQLEFPVKSKFGQLKVKLSDIKRADRQFHFGPSEMRKTVSVDGMALLQRQPVATGIRVNQGDTIEISADGNVNWTNWNKISDPEGLDGQGNYENIRSGTLCAKIGSGKAIKIGKQQKFVASASGTLYLGIAMQASYLNNSSYRWVGSYNATIRVTPQ